MAIYTTLFVMSAAALTHAFSDWKPALSEPETRVVTTFFGPRTVQTREPLFEPSTAASTQPKVAIICGDYVDYLEARLPVSVAKAPHWAAKGLTPVELDPLGELVDGRPLLREVLFSPPPHSSMLYEVRKEVISAIVGSPEEFARKWASMMSTREYTHSQTGVRVSPDWSTEDALRIIRQLVALAPKATGGASLYLLVE